MWSEYRNPKWNLQRGPRPLGSLYGALSDPINGRRHPQDINPGLNQKGEQYLSDTRTASDSSIDDHGRERFINARSVLGHIENAQN